MPTLATTTDDLEPALLGCGPWTLLALPRPGRSATLVLAPAAGPDDLASALHRARRRRPDAILLALVPASAPAGVVVAALGAGADDCVRGPGPAEVRARISAVHRTRCLAG